MKVTENDHSVGVVFPTTTGAIESKGCKNCWTCGKFLMAIKDHRVEMECLAHTDCTNGSEWVAEWIDVYDQQHCCRWCKE